MKEIKIPYVVDCRRRDIFFNDVKGYSKYVQSIVSFDRLCVLVTYKRGDLYCQFCMENKDYITFTCFSSDLDTEIEYDFDLATAEKFLSFTNH